MRRNYCTGRKSSLSVPYINMESKDICARVRPGVRRPHRRRRHNFVPQGLSLFSFVIRLPVNILAHIRPRIHSGPLWSSIAPRAGFTSLARNPSRAFVFIGLLGALTNTPSPLAVAACFTLLGISTMRPDCQEAEPYWRDFCKQSLHPYSRNSNEVRRPRPNLRWGRTDITVRLANGSNFLSHQNPLHLVCNTPCMALR